MLLTEISDPRLKGVHVTHVRVTPDLRQARVYFGIRGERSREREVLKAFRRSKGYLKKGLSSRIRLRFVPELEFFYDESEDVVQKIESLFHEIENERVSGGSSK